MALLPRPEAVAGARTVALMILAVVALRLTATLATPLELAADEAQYWRWAQTPDWGYFSKPPLVAWIIAASTALLGDAEWAIRAPSALMHGVGAFLLYLLGRRVFSPEAGLYAAAAYLVMPGVTLSSAVMSTDAALLPLWCAALLSLRRLRDHPTLWAGALFGLVVGAAMLAKYAALYLVAGTALAAIVDPPTRRALLGAPGLAAAVVFALAVGPNLLWNAQNDFATVSHTTDNANWENAGFQIGHLFRFITDQMGVFGPVTFLILIAYFVLRLRRPETPDDHARLWLACFILPPLLIIAGQAVIARAHANWAASAYPAAAVLVGSLVCLRGWGLALRAGLAIQLGAALLFAALAIAPGAADRIGLENALKRARGWSDTAAAIADAAARHNATAVLIDEREVWHEVDYYGRTLDLPPHRLWRRHDAPRSFAESFAPLTAGGAEDDRVLVVSEVPEYRPRMRADFAAFEPAGDIVIPLSASKSRTFRLYLASDFRPIPRDAAYEARFSTQRED